MIVKISAEEEKRLLEFKCNEFLIKKELYNQSIVINQNFIITEISSNSCYWIKLKPETTAITIKKIFTNIYYDGNGINFDGYGCKLVRD